MPAGKGRYTIGGKGTHGCKGYPVVGGEGKVHGCHTTRGAAMRQQAAIYASENNQKLADIILELAKSQDILDEIENKVEKMSNEIEEIVEINKKDYSSEQRRSMARRGMAMPDGSFPIANKEDLQNAIQSVGRASNYEDARRHIMRRARALNAMNMLPEDWNAKKNLSSTLFKGMPTHANRVNTTGNAQVSFNIHGRENGTWTTI